MGSNRDADKPDTTLAAVPRPVDVVMPDPDEVDETPATPVPEVEEEVVPVEEDLPPAEATAVPVNEDGVTEALAASGEVVPVQPEGDETPADLAPPRLIPVDPLVSRPMLAPVTPGQVGGLSYLVVRSLGMGDSGNYTSAAVERVRAMQRDEHLEPNGVVDGATWGLVLREVKQGDRGQEVRILRDLLGLPHGGSYDEEVASLIGPVCDSGTWMLLITDGK